MTSVVKTVFVRGDTNALGNLDVVIHPDDANLSRGRWRMCLDTFLFRPTYDLKAIPMSVSTTLIRSHQSITHGIGTKRQTSVEFVPTRILIAAFSGAKDTVVSVITRRKEWMEMMEPNNNFTLQVLDIKEDIGIKGTIYATFLIERVHGS